MLKFTFRFLGIILFIYLLGVNMFAQGERLKLDFDSCKIVDRGSAKAAINVFGNVGCSCGLIGDAGEFGGLSDGIEIGSEINSVFDHDFTIDFYTSFYNFQDITDILTFSNQCLKDSFLTLQYLPTIKDIRLMVKLTDKYFVQIDGTIDDTKCWHHIGIVRNLYDYFLYIDGKKVGEKNAEYLFVFPPSNRLTLSNNPCTKQGLGNHHRLKGYIDEFRIFNYAKTELELSKSELKSDMILNQDTTLFLGESLKIELGPTCAESFNWTNKSDLDDPDNLTPIITPKKSTTYNLYLTLNNKTCKDSINIYIQNKDSLDCNNLLLPNSFTPNDDGLNETIGISNKFIVQKLYYFDIFDRWGTRVFDTQSIGDAWDGSYKGKKLNPDKYIYKVSYICKDKEFLHQGIINLLR